MDKINIDLTSLTEQRRVIFKHQVEESIKQLEQGLSAPIVNGPAQDLSTFPTAHLKPFNDGWQPPHPDLVRIHFKHFQELYPEHGSNQKLAELLGMRGTAAHTRMREYQKVDGKKTIPYDIWRRFLIITGQVQQEIEPVFCIYK